MVKQTVKDIASWRKERNGMTQKELAMRSGVTERTIANYEKDATKLQDARYMTVNRIAEALEITTDQIFLGYNSEKPKLVNS